MIIGELIVAFASLMPIMASAVVAFLELVALVLSVTLRLLFWLLRFLLKKPQPGQEQRDARGGAKTRLDVLVKNKWFKRITIVSVIAFTLTFALAVIMNSFLFETTTRWLINAAAGKAGAQVTFTHADGNFFAGRIELEDVAIVRRQHNTTDVDLKADKLLVDLNLWALAFGSKRVELARADKLTGQIDRVGVGPKKPWFSRPKVTIDEFELTAIDIQWTDQTRANPLTLNIKTDHWRSDPLRSRWMVFDLLFHTNAKGDINGARFVLDSNNSPTQGQANWTFTGVPAQLSGEIVGGPLKLLDSGEVDIEIKNRWGSNASLTMDWAFTLRDPHATAPPGQTGALKKITDATVNYLNEQDSDIRLAFTLQDNHSGLKGTASLQASGLLSRVTDALIEEIKQSILADMAGGADKIEETAGKVKGFFKDRFKPEAEETPTEP